MGEDDNKNKKHDIENQKKIFENSRKVLEIINKKSKEDNGEKNNEICDR